MSAFTNTMHESLNFSEVYYYYYSCESQQLDQFTQESFVSSQELSLTSSPSTRLAASITIPGRASDYSNGGCGL